MRFTKIMKSERREEGVEVREVEGGGKGREEIRDMAGGEGEVGGQ